MVPFLLKVAQFQGAYSLKGFDPTSLSLPHSRFDGAQIARLYFILWDKALRFLWAPTPVIYVLSLACLEDNVPREVVSRQSLFALIIIVEISKICSAMLCLNIPEMWRSDVGWCWPIQHPSVAAWHVVALLCAIAIALLPGLYHASAGAANFLLTLHSSSKDA